MKNFFQKKLFLRWAARNRRLFSQAPYRLRQRDGSLVMGFRGVSRHIECRFSERGDIVIQVYYRKEFCDIVQEFDLYEEQTPEGRWLCRMCRDWPNQEKNEPLIEYEDRAALWIKHSFEPLAAWVRESFTRDASLLLCRYRGSTAAVVARGERLKEIRKRRDFFKKLPVLTARKGRPAA